MGVRRYAALLSLVAALAALGAGCGGGDNNSGSTGRGTTTNEGVTHTETTEG